MEIFHMDNDNTHLFFRFGYKVSPEDELSLIHISEPTRP